MKIQCLDIPDVKLITPDVFEDQRGFFFESWNRRRLAESGLDVEFVQDNHSKSEAHTLRGLHYQVKQPQGKLVRILSGSVFDVAVDIRSGSSTFGSWAGVVLSAENKLQLWIPPGFAHGFLVLSDTADFAYKCTEYYDAALDRCVCWNDPAIGIDWPLPPDIEPLLSNKDRSAPMLADAEVF